MAGETFFSIFTGAPQSRYAGLAIIMAVIIVSLVILFGKDNIPFSQKFSFVLLIFLISLPSILLSLFQLTCLVRGVGANNQRWWCGAYAWVISIILIIYSILLIFVAVTALITGEKVLEDVHNNDKNEFQRNRDTATMIVEEYFANQMKLYATAGKETEGIKYDENSEYPEDYNSSPQNSQVQIQKMSSGSPAVSLQKMQAGSPSVSVGSPTITDRFENMDELEYPPTNDSFENMNELEYPPTTDSFGNNDLMGDQSLPSTYKTSKNPYAAMTDTSAYPRAF